MTSTALGFPSKIGLATQEIREGENEITRGYYRIGHALNEISRDKLYRDAGFPSLEAFCAVVLKRSRAWANQRMSAETTAALLLEAGLELPENERIIRPITKKSIPPEIQVAVWRFIQGSAVDGNVTTRHVNAVVEVVKQAMQTGAIDTGSGESTALSEAFQAAITAEEYEAMMRQRQRIADSQKGQRVYYGNAVFISGKGQTVTVQLEGELPPDVWGRTVRLTVYTTE
jgi:hypothetical protein